MGFFVTNVNIIKLLKEKNLDIYILGIGGVLVPIFLWMAESRWGALFTAWNIMLIFYLADKVKLGFKQIIPLYIVMAVVLFEFLILYPKTYNPNSSGMSIFFLFFLAMIALSKIKEMKPMKYIYSVIHILLLGVVFYEIVLYRARTATLGLIFGKDFFQGR